MSLLAITNKRHLAEVKLSVSQSQTNLAEYYAAFFLLFAVLEFNKTVGSTVLNGLGIWYNTSILGLMYVCLMGNADRHGVMLTAGFFLLACHMHSSSQVLTAAQLSSEPLAF